MVYTGGVNRMDRLILVFISKTCNNAVLNRYTVLDTKNAIDVSIYQIIQYR